MITAGRRALLAAGIAVTLMMAGCGSDRTLSVPLPVPGKTSLPVETPTVVEQPTESAEHHQLFPLTIHSPLGDAVIEKQPERVATLGWGPADAALSIGITPAGMPTSKAFTTDKAAITPWVADALSIKKPTLYPAAGSTLPYDDIEALKPDVILAVNSGLQPDQFTTLNKIAPTVAYPDHPFTTGWKQQTRIVGAALGKQQEAEHKIVDIENLLKKLSDDHPEFAGLTFAVITVDSGKGMTIHFSGDPTVQLLADLGMTPLPAAEKLTPDSQTTAPFEHTERWEDVTDFDPDILVVSFRDTEIQSHTETIARYKHLRAVAQGSTVIIDDKTLSFALAHPTALSIPWMIGHVTDKLTAAAAAATKADARKTPPALPVSGNNSATTTPTSQSPTPGATQTSPPPTDKR